MEHQWQPLNRVPRTALRHIVMAEGEDSRIISGARQAIADGIARITLIGNRDRILKSPEFSSDAGDVLQIIDPDNSELTSGFAERFQQLRAHKGVTSEQAMQAVLNPLGFAAMMVRENHADGTIAGAVATTTDTVRAALQIIGKAADADMVSSFFLMVLDRPHHTKKGIFIFSDAGLTIEPDVPQLASIAIASATSFQQLTGQEPRIAMLSFSTSGSAAHHRVDRVVEATALVQSLRPDLKISGELQFDAAFVPEVAASKAPGAIVQGDANVFVFPSLEAANIGYKIAQRIGGAEAIGPVLQGLLHPANDLSRGCNALDVRHLIAVTCAQVKD